MSTHVLHRLRAPLANTGALALLAATALVGAALDEPYMATLAAKVAIFALAGVGLNLALGYGGMVSLGHAAFFGLGGYAAGMLAWHARNYIPLEIGPFETAGTTYAPFLWLTAAGVGAFGALIMGALSLRSSGVYFIMITLAFAQMLYYFAISWPAYGGEDGLPLYMRSDLPGVNMFDPLQFFWIAFGLLCAGVALCGLLTASRFGLALQGARQNEARLASVGISPFRIRLAAFAISGALTALAGALYADLNRFVSPDMLSWRMSGEIMVFVILGGAGRLCGPVLGAALFIALEYVLSPVTEFWQALLGALLLAAVLYAPGGVMGVLIGRPRHG